MNNEVSVKEEPRELSQTALMVKKLMAVKNMIAPNATNDELILFAEYCKSKNLDPFANQIHFVKRKSKNGTSKATFQTSIDGYRATAERTSVYAGSDDYLFDDNKTQYEMIVAGSKHPVTATVTVYRLIQGQRVGFSATAAWSSYYPGGNLAFMWDKMPFLMLGKVAEALALRKAFPTSLSGLYVQEEMQQSTPNDKPLPAPIEKQKPEVVHESAQPEESTPVASQEPTKEANQTTPDEIQEALGFNDAEVAQANFEAEPTRPVEPQEPASDRQLTIIAELASKRNMTLTEIEIQFAIELKDISKKDAAILINALINSPAKTSK